MKLSLTDEFLWNMYNTLEKGAEAVDFLFFTSYIQKANRMGGAGNPFFKKFQSQTGRKKFSQLMYKAKVRGWIKIKSLEGKKGLMLTKRGMGKALRASFSIGGRAKRPDGKWLMVIFDIPTAHPKARSLMRSVLRNMGYKMFQQSVWVTPYDVSEKTEKLLQFYSLEKYVKIFLIEELDVS
jgi:CRISPR-associated endonuclease Cas2